ncbi:hypothetical protein GQ44DRAFT_723008 [Phaeosphaeriaceae sp. PMI808]|nr:hypothetical protein GQ44DRAFT_723008 [Phaeosphaeriaceae sp. PMI808]
MKTNSPAKATPASGPSKPTPLDWRHYRIEKKAKKEKEKEKEKEKKATSLLNKLGMDENATPRTQKRNLRKRNAQKAAAEKMTAASKRLVLGWRRRKPWPQSLNMFIGSGVHPGKSGTRDDYELVPWRSLMQKDRSSHSCRCYEQHSNSATSKT